MIGQITVVMRTEHAEIGRMRTPVPEPAVMTIIKTNPQNFEP